MKEKTIIFQYNVDSDGNPTSTNIEEIAQVSPLKYTIQLEQIPDEQFGVILLNEDNTEMVQVFNYDEVETIENSYYVNYTNGIVYFNSVQGSEKKVINYYGTGVELISCKRVFDGHYDANGKWVTEILQDIIDAGREAFELMKNIGDIVTILQLLETKIAEGDAKLQELQNAIDEANDLTKVTGNEEVIINTSDWVSMGNGEYYAIVNHPCASEKIHVTFKRTISKENVLLGYTIIDDSSFKVFNHENVTTSCIINAMYYRATQTISDDIAQEVIDARDGKNSLGDRINLIESDVNNLNLEVSNLNSDVNNLNSEVDRINDSFNIVDKNGDIFSLYNSVPQGSVIYVLGEIDCLSKKLILNKPIKIIGLSKDATLKNVSIDIQSSDVFLSNFKIKTTMDNGVACNSGSYKNIRLYDIDSEAVAHSFLFENYNGIVEDVILENCTARNSINGFISKSRDVSFINCKSYGCGLNFGLVSDNIPSATQVANCERTNVINCCAIGGSYGLHLYCRDKYNTDCVPRNRNNRIVNFTVKDCSYPIQVGENVLYTGYKSIKEVERTIFENIIVDGADNGQWSILLSNGTRCSFNNCSLINKIEQVSAYQCVMSNILVKSENYVGQKIFNIEKSNAVIDTSMYNVVEVQYNANNNNTINLINRPNSTGLINVFIRTNGANGVSFGGFGSNIVDNNNILKTLNFNEGQNITFAFMESVQKFIPILVTKNIKYA